MSSTKPTNSTGNAPPGAAAHWHTETPDQALEKLLAAPHGLSNSEATERLHRHGPNRLQVADGPGLWRRMLAQFNNLLILVLLTAAAVKIGRASCRESV